LNEKDKAYLATQSNKANALLNLQTEDLNDLYRTEIVDGFRFAELNKMLINFCDEMGKSERIANTVFPTTYNYYTKIFIWIFIVFVTMVTAQSIGAWSILAGTMIGYVFLTTHKIGLSLLNPFEEIASGIPLNQITRTIEINMLEALKEEHIPAPVKSVNGEYIM
jgi:putative membrane protein